MTWGIVVKRIQWILVSCLFGAVLLTALPGVDAPDTTFNEMDTPVFVSHSVLPRLRSMAPLVLVGSVPESSVQALIPDLKRWAHRFKGAQKMQGSDSLQPLLCTFLI
jgi:hypothetical protein